MESENICNMKQEETQENIMSQKSRENGFNMDGWEEVWMGGQINRWKECSSISSATKEKKMIIDGQLEMVNRKPKGNKYSRSYIQIS